MAIRGSFCVKACPFLALMLGCGSPGVADDPPASARLKASYRDPFPIGV